MKKSTERDSQYRHLEKMSSYELLSSINNEDKKVATCVESIIPQIESFVEVTYRKMKEGGRLFYIGAGTSGRLGILDASECPPTFGVPDDWVIGIIAGGDGAIRKAVEFAEDDMEQGFKDLEAYDIDDRDVLVGIAASGTTPYVIGAMRQAQEKGIITGCICCNHNAPLQDFADYPMVVELGPEFVTGSTRMKSGTAQKLILNMISTSVMIMLGRVKDNKMVDMQLSNDKLLDRGARMIMEQSELDYDQAMALLKEKKSVRAALKSLDESIT